MDLSDIIQIVRRRQARFQPPCRSGSREPMDETSRVIVEEYDSLLAEIEALVKSGATKVAANQPGADSANQVAEAEILGDQGQSGG